MIISFFGHSMALPYEKYEDKVMKLLEDVSKGQHVDFYLGGYGNFDAFGLQCARQFKKKHPDTKILLICPYIGKWLDNQKDYIKTYYDGTIYPEIEHVPLKFAIVKRNEWMVRQADYIIAYVFKHHGGAYKALLCAHKHNTPYTNLYEGNYEIY